MFRIKSEFSLIAVKVDFVRNFKIDFKWNQIFEHHRLLSIQNMQHAIRVVFAFVSPSSRAVKTSLTYLLSLRDLQFRDIFWAPKPPPEALISNSHVKANKRIPSLFHCAHLFLFDSKQLSQCDQDDADLSFIGSDNCGHMQADVEPCTPLQLFHLRVYFRAGANVRPVALDAWLCHIPHLSNVRKVWQCSVYILSCVRYSTKVQAIS